MSFSCFRKLGLIYNLYLEAIPMKKPTQPLKYTENPYGASTTSSPSCDLHFVFRAGAYPDNMSQI